jgi:2-oxoglutarate ferredoxin oxidoreductase subunit alpha
MTTIDSPAPTHTLMEGSEALVRAAMAAGCRFFAGYPMTPFTEVLEHFARLLPDVGGVCINAESELEAVGMAWGALATGARAATGSTGQGLSLMQESFSEITLAELPLVIFNLARGQQDYFQATRGGGHGDYRHIVLAPQDVREGVELVQLAFHLADKWRNPVLLYGDYLLAHTHEALAVERIDFDDSLPAKDWAVDGTRSGTRESRAVTPLGVTKPGEPDIGQEGKAQLIATKIPLMEREVRSESGWLDDAETVVVAFGSPAKFVKYAIGQLRAAGHRIGYVRPVTLWPFPYDAVSAAARSSHVRRVGSFELSAGQMIDDVRIGVAGAAPVEFIGGVSTDHSGFGVGRILDVEEIAARILALHEARAQPIVPGYERMTYQLQDHQREATALRPQAAHRGADPSTPEATALGPQAAHRGADQ